VDAVSETQDNGKSHLVVFDPDIPCKRLPGRKPGYAKQEYFRRPDKGGQLLEPIARNESHG
jgi:hypothetical protein